MAKAVPSSTEFRGGGLVLQTDVIKKGEEFFRITFASPVNVGIYPGDDDVNETRNYKERNYKFVDAPCNEAMEDWYQRYLQNCDPLYVESKKGCELFVPYSNIVSVNVRSEYPPKWFHLIQWLKRIKNWAAILAGYAVHIVVLIKCD